MSLSVKTEKTGSHVDVVILGEVDVSCAPDLTEALAAVLEDDVDTIDVDMAQVPYIDSTGIGVLVAAAHRAQDAGSELTVSRPQPNVLRVLTLLGVGSEFNVNEA
ncbi:STAS domain-containing protein [Caniella muris]|uniref:STAS domain-containing protein n=1 Tax=Caniella muris TaxID=2941502 RepID=UPI00203E4FD3|nr:STAS domain-containing protein [Caniella muris]